MPIDPLLVAVARDASTSSFHLAMILSAALLLAGALANAIGIQNRMARPEAEREEKEAASATPA